MVACVWASSRADGYVAWEFYHVVNVTITRLFQFFGGRLYNAVNDNYGVLIIIIVVNSKNDFVLIRFALFIADRVFIGYFPWTWSHCWFWIGVKLWKVRCRYWIKSFSLPSTAKFYYVLLFKPGTLTNDCDLLWFSSRRYGLLGLNGCGKSTLLTAIGMRELPIPEHMDIHHLSREIEASDMSALEAVITCDEERLQLEKEAETLAAQVCLSNKTCDF